MSNRFVILRNAGYVPPAILELRAELRACAKPLPLAKIPTRSPPCAA